MHKIKQKDGQEHLLMVTSNISMEKNKYDHRDFDCGMVAGDRWAGLRVS